MHKKGFITEGVLIALAGLTILGITGSLWFAQKSDDSLGAPKKTTTFDVEPFADSTYEIGSSTGNAYLKVTTDELCLTGDTCQTAWPAGGGGGGDSTLFTWNESTNFISTDGSSTTATTSLVTFTASSSQASTTALTAYGNVYFPALVDGCLETASGLVTSTGADCGTGAGGGLATGTPWTAGDIAEVVDNGTVRSTSTISASKISTDVTLDSEINTESLLQSFLSDVTDIFTNNDGALTDDDLSDNSTDDLTQGATNLYNQTHSGEVTGATTLTIASNVVDEDNLLINTPTDDYILVASSSATGGFEWVATSTARLGFATGGGSGTVTSVDATVPTGWTISGNPITTSGTLALNYDTGYGAVLTASSTEWNSFFTTPSTRITAGTGIDWSTNTLNVTLGDFTTSNLSEGSNLYHTTGRVEAILAGTTTLPNLVLTESQISDLTHYTNADVSSYLYGSTTRTDLYTDGNGLTWSGTTLNFDGGDAPAGELGGTWASPTIDDSLAVTSWNLTTPTLTSFFGTPCTGNNFLQDISDTGAFTCVTATGGGGGGALSTTTEKIMAGAAATVSYLTDEFMLGGSSSTTAEFLFDYASSTLEIRGTAATSSLLSSGSEEAVIFGEADQNSDGGWDLVTGLEWVFKNATSTLRGVGTTPAQAISSALNWVYTGIVDLTGATVNFGAGAIDAITEIASGLKSGLDATLITGTAGTNGNITQWNGDGDLVDGGLAVANIYDTGDGALTDDDLTNNNITDLSDVTGSHASGSVLVSSGSLFNILATSSLGFLTGQEIDTESELQSFLTDVTDVFTNNDGALSDDDLSNNSTTDLSEGTNLYHTTGRVEAILAGTTTLPNLTTLLGLTNATTSGLTVSGNSYITSLSQVPLYVDSTGKIQSGGSGASGNCIQWGANNTLADSGSGCGGGASEWSDNTTYLGTVDAGRAVSIGTTTAPTGGDMLTISASSTDTVNLIVAEDTDGNTVFQVDDNGNTLINRGVPSFIIEGNVNTGGGSGSLTFQKSRGTFPAETVVQNGDTLGQYFAKGYDGDSYEYAAGILFKVDGQPGNADMPGSMFLRTTPDGANNTVNRLSILNNGYVGVATDTPSSLLTVGSSTLNSIAAGELYRSLFTSGELEVDGTLHADGGIDMGASTNLAFDGANILSDSAGTLTLDFVDVLGSVAEATIEAALDTLTALTDVIVSVALEIPNGTGPTVDATGEIALDTTDNQLLVGDSGNTARVFARATQKIWSTTISSTSPAFIQGGLLKIPTELDGYTMTQIRCSTQGTGSPTKVIAVEDEATNSTEDITCAETVTSDDGSITNATVTAGEEMYIDFGASGGTQVDYVSISVFGQWTIE